MDAMATETMTNETMFNQDQIQHLSSLRFINKIDDHLNIVSGVRISTAADHDTHHITLLLDIYYNDKQIDNMSFDLHNFGYEDIVYVAQNIRSNEFILQEVDILLSGDIE